MIYHILPKEDWAKARAAGIYEPESLPTEGFIHCSTVNQVIGSANAFFKGQTDLLLLTIDPEKVRAEVRYEDLAGEGLDFPHIYGPLNLDAVLKVSHLGQNQDGTFTLPTDVSAPAE